LAYSPDDGFIYTMSSYNVFARYSTAGVPDAAVLPQPGAAVRALTYIGSDLFLGVAGNSLYQYDRAINGWTVLTSALSQSFANAGLALHEGVLYAVTSGSNQLFSIDLPDYTITGLGSRSSSNGGGLSSSCKGYCVCRPITGLRKLSRQRTGQHRPVRPQR
jgi:hypothetical protein